MATARELGEQVNALRLKLGKTALKDPHKIGAKGLEERLAELTAEDARLNPPAPPKPEAKSAAIVEELDEDALIKPKQPETIKAMSYRLLQHVHRVDESDRRTVGLLYSTIISLIKKKFPKAETSPECLRWYSVHMRQEGLKLPQKRPRPLTRV